MSPQRIQLRRTKGWRKPDGAVIVARPSKWGNPYKIGERIRRDDPLAAHIDIPGGWGALVAVSLLTNQQAVDAFYDYILQRPAMWLAACDELAGHDLACWCPLDQPCHADVLLEVANP